MTNIDPRDQYDQLPSRLLVPKRGYIAQRPYFATYSGTTIANLNAQIAALNTSLGGMTASRDTWQQRANTAYDSGTWAAGTPWQTDYSNMVAQRDSLQAQLNAANAGIQPQINAALAQAAPAASANYAHLTYDGRSGQGACPLNKQDGGLNIANNGSTYTSIFNNGWYAASLRFAYMGGNQSGGTRVYALPWTNGQGDQPPWFFTHYDGQGNGSGWGYAPAPQYWNAGTQFSVGHDGTPNNTIHWDVTITFVPTSGNPHG